MGNKYSLTFPQKNIWLVENFYNNKTINVISGSLKIYKDFNRDVAEKTINKFVELNDAMRINIEVKDGKPENNVKEYEYFTIDSIDEKNEKKIKEIKENIISKPMDILSSKLYYYLIIDKGNGVGEIFLKVHHIISDAWSVSKMGESLANIYDKMQNGEKEFADFPSYVEFIQKEQEYINGEKYKADSEFWKEYLKGFSEPVGLKNTENIQSNKAKRYETKLNKKLETKLNEYCRENKVSPYSVFMTALAIYMERVTEKQDLVIGTPILNRSNFAEKNMQGMFVSTMPVRFCIDESVTFKELCKKSAIDTMSLFRHQKYPYSKISEEHNKETESSNKLYNVMLSYQNARTEFANKEKFEITWDFSGEIQDELEIHVSDLNNDGRLKIFYDYLVCSFETVEIKYLAKRIEEIIRDGIENDKTVETINIMPEEEKNKILYEFNNTKRDYPKNKTVIALFEEQVEKNPNNIALVFEGQEMTYKELNEKANSVAGYLKKQGVEENDMVGITLDKSFELMISILGTLKVGACYVPIDTNYTNERKKYMLEDAECRLNIVCNDEDSILSNNSLNIFNFEYDEYSSKNIKRDKSYTWDSLVYVMYTSGTTGKPKGAMITNRNIVRLVKNTNYIEFKGNDRIIQTGATVFDACTFEYWGALLNGLSLYLIKKEDMLDPKKLEKFLKDNKISIMWLTAPLFNQMVDINVNIFSTLRILLTGGDVLSVKHISKMQENCKDVMLVNGYGPTENTTFSNCHIIDKKYKNRIPIGKPIANSTSYVVDSKQRVLPIFVEGELYAGGDGVSKGYVKNNELTKQKYINNFFTKQGLTYKTGDIARWLNDGTIDFIGRRDNQVKIRGFRIELDEIKKYIVSFEKIKDCIIIVNKTETEQKELLCYFISKQEENVQSLREYLMERLPNYMIPNKIMQIDSIPLNQNGKVDSKLLPVFKETIIDENNLNETNIIKNKKELIKIYKKVLNVKTMVEENFWKSGGDSLTAIRIANEINKKYNINISYSIVIEQYTINKMLKYIQKTIKTEKNTILIPEKEEYYPLSDTQLGILSESLLSPNKTLYNIPFEIKINSCDNIKLIKSIKNVINSNETIFLQINIKDNNYMQKVVKDKIEITPHNVTLQQYNIQKEKFVQPFNLVNSRLFRIEMYIIENQTNILMDFNHIIFDGTSINNLIKNIQKSYNEDLTDNEQINMGQWILLENMQKGKPIYEESRRFFNNMFSEEFSKICIRNNATKKEARRKTYISCLNKKNSKIINKFVIENKITQGNIFLAAYIYTLSKLSYSEDIVIGTTFNGRNHKEQLGSLGCYIKNIPLRVKIKRDDSIITYIKNIQKTLNDVIKYSIYSQEKIFKTLNLNRTSNNNSLFNMMYIYQNINEDMANINLGGNKLEIYEISNNVAKMDIIFNVYPENELFKFKIEYNEQKYSSNFIREFYRIFTVVVEYFLKKDCNLTDIDILSTLQMNNIKKIGNNKTLHKKTNIINLLKEQYIQNSKSIVIKTDEENIDYEQLWMCSNKIANYLLNKGLSKKSRIAIEMNRTPKLIMTIIGILKIGSCYVPIDKNWPSERKQNVLKNGNIKHIITDSDNLYSNDIELINIDNILKNEENQKDIQTVKILPSDLAYIIFTSGTTGIPKAVMIKHDSVINYIEAVRDYFNYKINKNILSVTTVAFDIFVFEIFPTICLGNTLCLANDIEVKDPNKLLNFIKNNNVNKILTTPSRIQLLLDCFNDKKMSSITDMYIGGEPFNLDLLNKLNDRLPNVNIYNCYGPTETTVYSCFKNLKHEKQITVGKPINNTQIYIIDKYNKLAIPGVIGQICIGGLGKFKGYYNNTKLTQDTTFKLPETGDVLYKTGDIGYWNNNELICLGRVDNQVKIRGYRVELDEINEISNLYQHIKSSVTIVKKINNTNVLCLYYVKNHNFELNEFTDYLKSKLPQYMVPQYITELKSMPLNSNGKINKIELLTIRENDIKSENNEKFTIMELKIYSILKDILKTDNILKNQNLFEIGLDSLLAMKVIIEASNKNINIEYSDIFEYPTIEKLSKSIEKNQTEHKLTNLINNIDYKDIEKLLNEKVIKNIDYRNDSNILIFGATGFLGIHILSKYIDNYKGKVYCVIRNKNNIDNIQRLKNILKYYFGEKYNKLIGKRIIIIDGDIQKENIFNNSEEIMSKIDLVINAAALVKHFGNINEFEKVNVISVLNIINLCEKNKKRLIHISTTSVSGDFLNRGNHSNDIITYDETKLYVKQSVDNNYIYTKFMAEYYILQEVCKGKLDATIMRMGNLMGRSTDGKFQLNFEENAFAMRIKSIEQLKEVPSNIIDKYIEFTPIDFAAEAVLKLACNYTGNIYHIYDNNYITIKEVINIISKDIKIVSENEFYNYLLEFAKLNVDKIYIYEMLADVRKNKKLDYDSNIHVKNDITNKYLKLVGFEWLKINRNYVIKFIKDLIKKGYLGDNL